MPSRICNTLITGTPRQRIEARQDQKINECLATISTITSKPLRKRTPKDKQILTFASESLINAKHIRCELLMKHDNVDWVFVPMKPQ